MQLVVVDVGQGDRRPGLGKGAGGGQSHAGAGAGHQRDAAGEVEGGVHHECSFQLTSWVVFVR
jgi:hypothetical protein